MAETIEVYFLTVLEAESSRSRFWQGWFPLKTMKEESVLSLSPDLQTAPFSLCPHVVSPPCMYTPSVSLSLCIRVFSSKDRSQISKAHPNTLILI